MNILHVVPTAMPVVFDRGGAVQRRALAVAKEQVALGHSVWIFSPGGDDAVLDGVTIVGINLKSRRPMRDYEYLTKVRRAVRNRLPQADVIHSHGVMDAARFLAPFAKRSVITVDYFAYALSRFRWGKSYCTRSLRRYDIVSPVSEFCRRELLAHYAGLSPEKVIVVPNGVDLDHFSRRPEDVTRVMATYDLGEGPKVLYAGRINRQKGSHLLSSVA